ncbi:MAG: DNA repair protein RecN [Christensenellales bacterium]|jgi:DNA repair protein RecN (Recombination protein N)
MIEHLFIQNIAIIDRLNVDFSEGLNILTGETGAGKSIVIDAVNLVLGGRADYTLVRSGCTFASVEAVFGDLPSGVCQLLHQLDIPLDEGTLILFRKLTLPNKSVCRINGHTVTLSVLKEAASLLVDVHGQHEHQSLLDERNHLAILDAFAQPEIAGQKELVACTYKQLKEALYALREEYDEHERIQRIDEIRRQIQEIDEAELAHGEEERLLQLLELLSNVEKIKNALEASYQRLYSQGAGCALECAGEAKDALRGIAHFDSNYEMLAARMEEVYYELEDIALEVRNASSMLEYSPEKLAQTEQRLHTIHKLKKTYGTSIPDILKHREAIDEELYQLEHSKEIWEKLHAAKEAFMEKLYQQSVVLSDLRKQSALRLKEAVQSQLGELGFKQADFEVSFAPIDPKDSAHYMETGLDKVAFLLSTNAGEPLKPLSKVASGGEVSRIMLAFKYLLGDLQEIQCMIFDEIDVGISGKTAKMVAQKLAKIALHKQVICITHLPQIAAMASKHFLIEKDQTEGRVSTNLIPLDEISSRDEIARIFGGETDLAKKHAQEMIKEAKAVKHALV